MWKKRDLEHRPYGRDRALPMTGRLVVMSVGLLCVTGLLLWPRQPRPVVTGVPVQVTGDVPRPGWYSLHQATLQQAILRAGGQFQGEDAPVPGGSRVVVDGAEVRVEASGQELVFHLPLDINLADAEALRSLPGIGPALSQAIVNERAEGGFFDSAEALIRVRGIGPVTIRELRPYLTWSAETD